MSEKPTVFISYSHDSEEHIQWVKNLSRELRKSGVVTEIDQDALAGANLGLFINQGLTGSQFIICVCSDNYVKKANMGVGGVGYEASIITQELLKNADDDHVIPIVRNNTGDNKVPTCLTMKKYIDFTSDERFSDNLQELASRILNDNVVFEQKKEYHIHKNEEESSVKNDTLNSIATPAPSVYEEAPQEQDDTLSRLLSLSRMEALKLSDIFRRQNYGKAPYVFISEDGLVQSLRMDKYIEKHETIKPLYEITLDDPHYAYSVCKEVSVCLNLNCAKLKSRWGFDPLTGQ